MKVKIAGVPEHFNFPWHYAISKGYFAEVGIEMIWCDFPGGTGAMATALKNNELDLALLLTEGAVKEMANGADFKIARPYVETPLVWGIHSSAENIKANISDLSSMRYAISRLGSGSHLMAYVHARANGVLLKKEQMVVVGDLEGARKSLANRESDLFLWERFMTKPLVDAGELKLLDTFPTPWPCFMLVAKETFMHKHKPILLNISAVLDKTLSELNKNKLLIHLISNMYKLQEEDTAQWLKTTKWSTDFNIKGTSIKQVTESLFSLNMITSRPETRHLFHDTVTIS